MLLVSLTIFFLTTDLIQEYELSIFLITSVIISITNILDMDRNMSGILLLIEKFEDIILKSES